MTKLDLKWGLRLIVHIASRLLRDSEEETQRSLRTNAPTPQEKAISRACLAGLAEAEYAQRRSRTKFLDNTLFADPAWDILLDLFAREARGLMTSVTSSCIASQVPSTTALRYIELLKDLGLIAQARSTTDRRVNFVKLTPKGQAQMTAYFEDHAQAWDISTGFMIPADEQREDLIER